MLKSLPQAYWSCQEGFTATAKIEASWQVWWGKSRPGEGSSLRRKDLIVAPGVFWGSDKSGSIRPRVAVGVAVTARESQLNGRTLSHHQVDLFSPFKTSFVRCRCDEGGGRGRDRSDDTGRR